jgi:two-component system cell cycle response regulator
MRILVADDEATSRAILHASLSRLGHELEVVADGAQAWASLSRPDAPALAILDWNMPGLDGPEICRRLRRLEGARYVYTILVTARATSQDKVLGLEAGADDFVAKPFDPEELHARVRAGQRIVELQAENERSRAYVGAILANIESGILLSDAKARIVYANEALASMSGMNVAEALELTREEVLLRHAGRTGDPERFDRAVGVGSTLPREAQIDFEIARAEPCIVRWTGKPIILPEGQGQLDLFRDVTAEVKRDRAREERLRVDHLTGLYNRRGAEEAFVREIARARRMGAPLGLVLADIDLFKQINDTYGHSAGDRALRHVSASIVGCARVTDVAIRWGGEELLVLLPGTDLAGCKVFAERMRASVEALRLEGAVPVTISCGAAQLAADEATLDATVARADGRLYEAKASGRNAVR